MNRTSVLLLLFSIIVFSFSFLLIFYGKSRKNIENLNTLEGLDTIYKTVKAAADAETTFINTLQDAAANPGLTTAISKLPDGGADINKKMTAALTSINAALDAASQYK
jgi:hypothetical protein